MIKRIFLSTIFLSLALSAAQAQKVFRSLTEAVKTPLEVKNLELKNESFELFPSEILQLKNLTRLTITNCGLKEIPEEFCALTNLNELDVSENNLTKLPQEIGNLTFLRTLKASGNQLTEIPTSVSKLENLRLLVLKGNRIKSLPKNLGMLSGLTGLDISYNQIAMLPVGIVRLRELNTIIANNNSLTNLPEDIRLMTGLSEIIVSNNHLTELPKEIEKLKWLAAIDVDNNNLKSLDLDFSSNNYFTVLYAANNQLSSWPSKLHTAVKIEDLRLSGNELKRLPAAFLNLKRLKTLELENNMITHVPDSIELLKNLRKINLINNPFDSLEQLVPLLKNPYLKFSIEDDKLRSLLELAKHDRYLPMRSDLNSLVKSAEQFYKDRYGEEFYNNHISVRWDDIFAIQKFAGENLEQPKIWYKPFDHEWTNFVIPFNLTIKGLDQPAKLQVVINRNHQVTNRYSYYSTLGKINKGSDESLILLEDIIQRTPSIKDYHINSAKLTWRSNQQKQWFQYTIIVNTLKTDYCSCTYRFYHEYNIDGLTGEVLSHGKKNNGECPEETDKIFFENGKYGIKELYGSNEARIPPEYDSLYSTCPDHIIAQREGNHGLISGNNEVIIPFKYEQIEHLTTDYKQRGYGLYLVVTKNGKKGLITPKGAFILKAKFSSIVVDPESQKIMAYSGNKLVTEILLP